MSPARARARQIRGMLVLCDALSVEAALLALRLGADGSVSDAGGSGLAFIIAPILWVALFHAFGLYRVLRRYQAGAIVAATACGTLLASIALPWSSPSPRSTIVWILVPALALELLGRWGVRVFAARTSANGTLMLRALVVGERGEDGGLQRRLAEAPSFTPVGLVSDSLPAFSRHDAPTVGRIADLDEMIRSLAVDCVFVEPDSVSPDGITVISRACRRTDAELRIPVEVAGVRTSRLSVDSIDGLVSVNVGPIRFTRSQAVLKRCFDVVVASVALLLALPFFVAIGVAIRLTSPGPLFFRQVRVTKGDRAFTMYKFRTMVVDHRDALRDTVIDLSQPFFKMRNDPRLTTVGRLLRSFSIDELPQLWNVLRGEMSLVGPRPLPIEQVQANREFLSPRHEIRGGMTGLWQISGRSDLDSTEALQIDRFYIDNWSLGFDAHILLKTVGAVLSRRGAL